MLSPEDRPRRGIDEGLSRRAEGVLQRASPWLS